MQDQAEITEFERDTSQNYDQNFNKNNTIDVGKKLE